MATTVAARTGRSAAERQVAEFGAVSAQGIGEATPMGANLVPAGGATFRVRAPNALEVHVRLSRTGDVISEPGENFQPAVETRLHNLSNGHWAGLVPGAREGDHYRFYIVQREQPYKRDPYARELEFYDWPNVDCIIRNPRSYPWHDGAFRTPMFHDAVIYQLHLGTFYGANETAPVHRDRTAKFLEAIDRIPYLAELGVTFLQPLPVVESQTRLGPSLGYNNTDLFSPEMDYCVEPQDLAPCLARVNELLAARGQAPLEAAELVPQVNQLKCFIDLCHLYGMGVLFDVVYNHAGGFDGDDQSIYFFDRDNTGDNDDSLYFMDQGWAGGLVFAYWNRDVRQFLIDNARFLLEEYHADGFRYDEVSVIDRFGGWQFCQGLSGTVRYVRDNCLQIAEFWSDDQSWAVRPTNENGAGFDSVVHAGLRGAVRGALAQAAAGRDAFVNLDPVRDALRPHGFPHAWQAVQHLENHDRQRVNNDNDREPRIAALADASNTRSWYARSRARVANGLLLTAPGIPMLFMGQEFLEDKYWTDNPGYHKGNLIWWEGLGSDRAMQDHLRFTRELIHLRRRHPALRADAIHPYYVHNENRILAFHRWLEGVGRDVVIAASLNESTFRAYELGFPQPGRWFEVFNSDVYDHWVNPWTAGNGGAIDVAGAPRDGMPHSGVIVIPANGIVVFARDRGD